MQGNYCEDNKTKEFSSGGRKLKAALLKAPGEVVLDEVPVPEISDDEVLLEVKYCGICGSDTHAVPDCLLYPKKTYMGHEISGVLSKVGRNVKGWQAGDRVVVNPLYACGKCYGCQHGFQSQCEYGIEHFIGCCAGLEHAGGFAKFVRVPIPEFRLNALPDELSFEAGVLVEPLAVSLHSVRMSAFKPRGHTMVLGAGMIGLGVIAHLKSAGAGLIIAAETIENRAKLARKLGADYVFDPQELPNLKERVFTLTNGQGVDVVFDCSGAAQAFKSATSFLRRGGQVLLTGHINQEVPILPFDYSANELSLQGSLWYYSDEFPMAIEFLQRGKLPLEELITSKIKLSNIIKGGFEVLLKPNHNEIKVIVEPE